jgi:hypothetical protein
MSHKCIHHEFKPTSSTSEITGLDQESKEVTIDDPIISFLPSNLYKPTSTFLI